MNELIRRLGLEHRLRKENLRSYLLQCTLAAVAVLTMLLALGLVLNEWNGLTLMVVLAGIIALSTFKRLVLPLLMDLL